MMHGPTNIKLFLTNSATLMLILEPKYLQNLMRNKVMIYDIFT